jgi:parallel beta-helix repeat protein
VSGASTRTLEEAVPTRSALAVIVTPVHGTARREETRVDDAVDSMRARVDVSRAPRSTAHLVLYGGAVSCYGPRPQEVTPMTRTLVLILTLTLLTASEAAFATTFNVSPGPGTPVQDAIDAASPGDTVRLAAGEYEESLTITKPLKLIGPRGSYLDNMPPSAVIAAGCTGSTTGITVAADNVRISDLRIITFTDYGIDVQGRNKIVLRNVLALPNCTGDSPLATINVVASTNVTIDGVWVDAFQVVAAPAIRLSAIPAQGRVRVQRTAGGYHDVGILIEDSAPGSVLVKRSYANYNNSAGILLRNSDGITVKSCQVARNTQNGIELDATSDNNVIAGNDIFENMTDVVDAGSGNCWKNNSFMTGTVPPCP